MKPLLYLNMSRRILNQRKEIKHLRKFNSYNENHILRREKQLYRKALSNIQYRIDQGEDIPNKALLSIVRNALNLTGLQPKDKRRIEEFKKDKNFS
jgi:hypothetical protein